MTGVVNISLAFVFHPSNARAPFLFSSILHTDFHYDTVAHTFFYTFAQHIYIYICIRNLFPVAQRIGFLFFVAPRVNIQSEWRRLVKKNYSKRLRIGNHVSFSLSLSLSLVIYRNQESQTALLDKAGIKFDIVRRGRGREGYPCVLFVLNFSFPFSTGEEYGFKACSLSSLINWLD